jgi:FemAB family protein
MPEVTLEEIQYIIKKAGLHAEFKKNSKIKWNDIVYKGKNILVFYMEHYVDYQTVLFSDLSKSSKDISLILFHDNRPIGVWPLTFNYKEKEPIKSINNQYGGVVIPPLFVENFAKKSQRKVIKSCIEFLNKLLEKSGGKCWRTNEVSLSGDISQWHQIALEYSGILDKVSYEMHLDLSFSIKEIRKFIRKSYRPLISSGQKKWTTLVMDKFNEEIWNKFRTLHKNVAGRITRSIDTWNIQHLAIKNGDAFLVYVVDTNKFMIGGGYFDMSNFQCHYSVATYDKDYSDQPIGHLIQHQAIITMREKGRKMYYIGDRFYKENHPFVTRKQVDISLFKQGFSSKIIPRIGLVFNLQK